MKVHRKSSDRISTLPEDTVEKILSHMPIRDAVRTSILSRKWRYRWTSMPKLVFNDESLAVLTDDEDINKYKFVDAIFHVLLLHKGPILEFSLSVTGKEIYNEIDHIILHLLRNNNIKKFTLEILETDGNYLLPGSLFSLQGLEHLDLSFCAFDRCPLMNKGFSTLKSLSFSDVDITNKMLFKFLTNCPLLEEFTWARDYYINIELTESELVKLFKNLPSVHVLHISKLYIKHLAAGTMPNKLPITLPHLTILVLDVCFLELSTVLYVISSSPNLEIIKLEMCWDRDPRYLQQTFKNLCDDQDYRDVNLDYLEEMEITSFRDCGSWMEFVKFIMAKALVLKKAQIELWSNVSLDEEVKMLRDLVHMPFPRASPQANFIIERPEDVDDEDDDP